MTGSAPLPSPGPAIAYVDGASRGNPGPAGAGALLLDAASGAVLREARKGLGTATNNEAEYEALLLALATALELGVRDLVVRADSQLVVRQIEGRYRVKKPHLQPLWKEARRRAATFASFAIEHVPRAENAQADRLANEAIDVGDL